MILDARNFEKMLVSADGGKKKIKYDHNAIILNLEDVRTFGGVYRFYMDSDGNPVSSGAQSQPIRVRNPIRLPEMSSFKMNTHLRLKSSLPKGVVAYITPTPDMAEAGLIINQQFLYGKNDLWVSALSMRKIEVEVGYPVALLVFTLMETSEKRSGKKADESVKSDQ